LSGLGKFELLDVLVKDLGVEQNKTSKGTAERSNARKLWRRCSRLLNISACPLERRRRFRSSTRVLTIWACPG
jgi:hypothetical protein